MAVAVTLDSAVCDHVVGVSLRRYTPCAVAAVRLLRLWN